MLEVYLYDENGLFTQSYMAHPDPLEPGQFTIPTLHSLTAPTIVAGTWPVAVNGVWVNEPDFRSKTVYDTTTGVASIYETIGALPSNLTTTAPTPVPQPDGAAFIQAVKAVFGGIAAIIAAANIPYSAFVFAVQDGDWADVQTLIVNAYPAFITSTQYASIKAAAITNNIPITL